MSDDKSLFGLPAVAVNPDVQPHIAGWLREKASRAVIACDARGHGAVLWWVGVDFYCEIVEAGVTDLGDLGLDDAPVGISIWEGRYRGYQTGNPLDGYEYSTDCKGSFRDPTGEEWALIQARKAPWDEREWLMPELHEDATP